MPSLFSRLKGRDGFKKKKNAQLNDLAQQLPAKQRWEDASARLSVEPREIQDLIRRCTEELKRRALDLPFLLLPFRPASDPSAVRTFIRHFFDPSQNLRGETLLQELRMTEPMVISGIAKWCWSRLQGGIVGWDAYELFKVGEQDSNMARDSFKTFIPLSVDNAARACIIFDYFDLMSAIAAHGKSNGLGGRKLSRMAAWWAFEQKDTGKGFEGGYQAWQRAADATSHLFFAYLRSLSPQQSRGGISMLPMSLQKLLQETEYPPERPSLMQSSTNKVLMHVDTVSPTPFALLRRANHFQYREEDRGLKAFSEYEDPVQALTEECRRVLKAISSANQSHVSSSKHSTSLRDASWSRFEDIGFASALEEEDEEDEGGAAARKSPGLRTMPASGNGLARPTTPSWADFLSTGFVDDNQNGQSNMLLPPDKVLPPIETTRRQRSSQSHRPRLEHDRTLEPGELASITNFDLEDSFWWVWMSSLAPEETPERKSAFGRCAVIETVIKSGRWLVMEEMVVGAAPEPQEGAYIAEKKGFFSWTRRNKGISRRKSTGKQALDRGDKHLNQNHPLGLSKSSIGPDQHARIQAAAAQLQAKQNQERQTQQNMQAERRGRSDAELMQEKTNSIMTLQPAILSEASQAMKWATKYDKDAIREAYLSDSTAGRGAGLSSTNLSTHTNGHLPTNGYSQPPSVPAKSRDPSPLPPPAPQMPMQISPAAPRFPEKQEPSFSEKAIEAPADLHPAERSEPTGRNSPLPPPPKEAESVDLVREGMVSPEPGSGSSPEGKKHKKLHKDKAPTAGGLRKLFGRKNRSSKVPDNAASDLNSMLQQEQHDTREGASPSPAPSPAPLPSPARAPAPAPAPVPPRAPARAESSLPTPAEAYVTPMERREDITPTQTRRHMVEPAYEPSVDTVSQVDTEDANEARTEFSRFDQGPLAEQPAFIPDDSDTDDAVPPPIARRKEASPGPGPVPDPSIEDLSKVQPVPAQDRWAQIRKNAAERAAQKQPDTGRTEADEDTSGEETIESRVARIKARVAELTGNMEGVQGPGAPPPRR